MWDSVYAVVAAFVISPPPPPLSHTAVSQLDVEWYPKEKVQQAKKKLIGGNPVYIMR